MPILVGVTPSWSFMRLSTGALRGPPSTGLVKKCVSLGNRQQIFLRVRKLRLGHIGGIMPTGDPTEVARLLERQLFDQG